jgi:hypothetical protein
MENAETTTVSFEQGASRDQDEVPDCVNLFLIKLIYFVMRF